MTFRLLPEAQSDIRAITRYIGQDSPKAAKNWFKEINDRFDRLGRMPRIGANREYVRQGLRTLPFRSYLIFYREIKGGVEIVRVLHGARDWENMF